MSLFFVSYIRRNKKFYFFLKKNLVFKKIVLSLRYQTMKK